MVKGVHSKGPSLNLECVSEELSPAQLEAYNQRLASYEAAEKEIERFKRIAVGDVIQNDYCIQFRTVVMVSTVGLTSGQSLQAPALAEPAVDVGVALPNESAAASGRGAKIIPTSRLSAGPKAPVKATPVTTAPTLIARSTPPVVTNRATPGSKTATNVVRPQANTSRTVQPGTVRPTPAIIRTPVSSTSSGPRPISRIAPRPSPGAPAPRPSPAAPVSSSKNDDDDDIEIIATKKVTTPLQNPKDDNKVFPSLSVVTRPVHTDSASVSQKKRQELDAIVKNKLLLNAAQFAEWLMQEGIVKTSQQCALHCGQDGQPVQLKLGKATDDSKFPHSGGYVWIGECCPSSFVSIFNGSIFGGSPHPPSTLLKLIYHWSCQTPVTNVIQWVKVDRHYLKSFFTLMRSVCTYGVQTGIKQCGTGGGSVEVGVISLGTTSTDGKKREVRVEVLGLLDQATKRVRLRAVEPVADTSGRHRLHRFTKILQPLKKWVHPGAKILTDFTVDRSYLTSLGFTRIVQKNPATMAPGDTQSNAACMDYLRKTVPKVFQNTLSLLSTNMIQQFLDELTWREIWAPNSLDAFQNIIKDIRGLTIADTSDPILSRLAKVAANPFGNWSETLNKPSLPQPKRTLYISDKLASTAAPKQVVNRKRPAPKSSASPTQAKRLREENADATYFGKANGKKVDIPKTSGFCFFCPISGCPKTFSDNLLFGKHLFSHVDNRMQLSELSDHVQCKYCFKVFATPYAMQSHMTSTHIENTKKTMCMICEEEFKEVSLLLSHLRQTHSAQEMPYVCEICEYRTSSHRDIVDHFHQEHAGTPFVMCHLCLKTFNVMGEKNQDRQNYIYHMKDHQKAGGSRKHPCDRCALVFLTNAKHTQHLKQHNTSIVGPITPFTSAEYPVLDELAKMTVKKHQVGDGVLLVNTFPDLTFSYLDETLQCFECKEPLIDAGHFSSYLCCANCRYATCCSKAMTNHLGQAHGPTPSLKEAPELVFSLGQTMHCVCGFMTSSGNALGSHLVKCGKNKCYPSKEAAEAAVQMEKSASFPPLVDLEDGAGKQNADEAWMNAMMAASGQKKDPPPPTLVAEEVENESQNMLRLLGLQPKERIESTPAIDTSDE